MDHYHEGVYFTELRPAGVRVIRTVEATLDDQIIGGSQLQTLDDVKSALATMVKAAGGNALIGFTYGQRSVSWWKSLLSIDDVAWWGKGQAAVRRAGR